MSFSLTFEHGSVAGLASSNLRRRIQSMIRVLDLKNKEISFVITNDKSIHELNRSYRGKNRPTDVLAFAMQEGEFTSLAENVLGDVIVSAETARRQAEERKVTLLEEVTMLSAHGLLHLLGWDHQTRAEDVRMRAETERLCQAARRASKPRAAKKAVGKPVQRKVRTRS